MKNTKIVKTKEAQATPVTNLQEPDFNKWWLSLPEEQQRVYREDRWRLADLSFREGFRLASEQYREALAEALQDWRDQTDTAIHLASELEKIKNGIQH